MKVKEARRDTWRWKSSDATQQAMLTAARELFREQGYTNTPLTDVVARAGVSVGSFYHHFGAKRELYVSLWQDYRETRDQACVAAVATAQLAGMTEPAQLWTAAARALLRDAWTRRDLAALFLAGDTPPNFDEIDRGGAFLARRSHQILRLPDDEPSGLFVQCLLDMIGEGARAVVRAPGDAAAERIMDRTLAYCARLLAGGPV